MNPLGIHGTLWYVCNLRQFIRRDQQRADLHHPQEDEDEDEDEEEDEVWTVELRDFWPQENLYG